MDIIVVLAPERLSECQNNIRNRSMSFIELFRLPAGEDFNTCDRVYVTSGGCERGFFSIFDILLNENLIVFRSWNPHNTPRFSYGLKLGGFYPYMFYEQFQTLRVARSHLIQTNCNTNQLYSRIHIST